MNQHQYKDLIIEVLNEPDFKIDSAGNSFVYNKHYFGDGGQKYQTSKHGIKIYRDDQIINSCIVIGSGGATGIHQHSSLLNENQLLLCCCDTIFCLTIPELVVRWQTRADEITCFSIFKHQDDYIIHGELLVTKLNKNGNKKWVFSGADIFVTANDDESFEFESEGILLTDFAKTKYKIDFDGNLIWDTYKS